MGVHVAQSLVFCIVFCRPLVVFFVFLPLYCLPFDLRLLLVTMEPSWPWSYSSWIYNYLCNQCLSPLMWVRISTRARCTTLCNKVCQWLATGQWFSPGFLVSSSNNTDRHNIAEILFKVALNTIKQTSSHYPFDIFNLYLITLKISANGTAIILYNICWGK